MKTKFLLIAITLMLSIFIEKPSKAQTPMPVVDAGAGIQREALWTVEKGILAKINWYNVLIKALNGDIKGITGEILFRGVAIYPPATGQRIYSMCI